VQAAPPLAAEAAGGAQQTEPPPAGGGGSTKMDKDKLRKERQRQRKLDQATEALQWAIGAMAEHGVRCVCVRVRACARSGFVRNAPLPPLPPPRATPTAARTRPTRHLSPPPAQEVCTEQKQRDTSVLK
jgi:hypothetical protein